ncbi:NAD(P)/FAD-dependent oxidoreductase [Sphingomonas sp. MMSM20]|uniref:NAD(P)/FAD-dependent oxidoreductase n=1 Tax=Sphingomonas lycopersici TaxID=2951807 RepID=UPI002238183D|nr:NAD(P)/FAD-dependent oxidoreductase [Sphingomonas lycopersici]
MPPESLAHHVVIVGAGFGGVEAARALADAPVRITLLDRRNYHLFQPLLYQVAGTALAPSDIAWPIRSLVRGAKNATTLLGEVVSIDARHKRLLTSYGATIDYDTLVLATGARHAYFGHDDWEPYAPGLKTIEDATHIRRNILFAFEEAERSNNPAERAAYLTFAIIGGGPTGVELAGTIAELAHETLRGEFRNFSMDEVRVILIEAGPRILPSFKEHLAAYAKRALERLKVEVLTDHMVTECDAGGVHLGETHLATRTILWAAGVQASPAGAWLDLPCDRAGRVLVKPDLTAPGFPDVFVIGDTAHVEDDEGTLVPGVAPAAKQEGRFVAEVIRARLAGTTPPERFRYKNDGSLATIGKRAAIVDFGWVRLRGRLAWWLWGFVHIFFLIGVRNRLMVALSWLWIYWTGQRSARLITQSGSEEREVSD